MCTSCFKFIFIGSRIPYRSSLYKAYVESKLITSLIVELAYIHKLLYDKCLLNKLCENKTE